MKKGKFLAVAALISCCTLLAACGGSESSSAETSSSTQTSEPDSSEDSTSGYSSSSEDSSSEDSSSYESSSEDSSSSSDSSSEDSSSSSSEDSSSEEPDPDSSSSEEPDPDSSSSEEPDPDSSSSEEPDPDSSSSEEPEPEINYYSVNVSIDNSSALSYTINNDATDGKYAEGTVMSISFTITDSANYKISRIYSSILEESLNVTYADDYLSAEATFTITSDVTISAITERQEQTYEILAVNNYYSSCISSISISAGETYTEGETVTFTFVTSNYTASSQIDNYKYQYYFTVNGTTYNPTSGEGGGFSTTYTCSFRMPSENVTIDLTYAQNNYNASGITASVTDDEYAQCISIVDGTRYSKYSSLYAVFKKKDGVTISSIDYKVDSGSWKSEEVSVYTYAGDSNVVYATILSSNFESGSTISIRATYSVASSYSLTLNNTDHVEISSTSSYSSKPTVGDSIVIYYQASEGYYISEAATITGVDEEDITENSVSSATYSKIAFTMPSNAVTISFNIANEIDLNATSSEGLESPIVFRSSLYDDDGLTKAAPGSTIYITANPASGYLLRGFTVNGEEYDDISYNSLAFYGGPYYYLEYEIPSDAASVSASPITYVGAVASTSISSSYAAVTFDSAETTATYAVGDIVNFVIDPTASYLVESGSVSVTNGLDQAVTVSSLSYNADGTVSGSYVMPESGAVLSASFGARGSVPLTLTTSEETSGSISSLSIIGAKSNATMSLSTSSATFVDQEEVSVEVSTSTAYEISVYAVYGSEETLIEKNADSTTLTYSFTLCTSSSLTSIKVVSTNKNALAVTQDYAAGVDVNYYIGSSSLVTQASSVSTLEGNVHQGDYVFIEFNSSASTGTRYYVSAYDADGNEYVVDIVNTADSETYVTYTYYRFAPEADFTLSIQEVTAPHVYIVDDEGLSYILEDANWTDIGNGDVVRPNLDFLLIAYEDLYYRAEYDDGTVTSGFVAADSSVRLKMRGCDVTIRITSSEYVPGEDEGNTATLNYSTVSTGIYGEVISVEPEERIVGTDGPSAQIVKGTVNIGDYVYIVSHGNACICTVTFDGGEVLTFAFESSIGNSAGISTDPFQITSDCTIAFNYAS